MNSPVTTPSDYPPHWSPLYRALHPEAVFTSKEDIHKRTGRTTRMLEKALRHLKEGMTVYVVAANHKEEVRLRGLLGEEGKEIRVIPLCDALDRKLRSSYPGDAIVFFDHYALEEMRRAR